MYLNCFDCKEDVFEEFRVPQDQQDIKILMAWYDQDYYEGDAFVLFERDGKLYEVHGGHCSCYGLEDQWDPEETSVEALNHYMDHGYFGYQDRGERAKQLKGVLYRWKRKQTVV
jgi:hypothetical protein